MLINFYLIAVVPLALGTLISTVLHNRELGRRGLTLLLLVHLICAALWYEPPGFTLLVLVLLSLGIVELSQHYPADHMSRPIAFGLGMLGFVLFVLSRPILPLGLLWFSVICMISFVAEAKWIQHRAFMFGFVLGVLALCSACLVLLARLHIQNIITIILLLQLNDILSLLFGKLMGRRRIFKTLSPNKTLEGYLMGGVGILLGLVLLHTVIPVFESFRVSQSTVVLTYFWVFGNIGDLLFSSLKRKLQIKDFSQILPGHGGVLDRFDNILFVAPGFYLLVQWNLMN
jgi:phosphatidate cytidylyltransferase